ncbi:SDR family NAD(P)-dependent oxidoreductase [Pseudomonas agarici]|uniref:SDR family NAD(P)-dependent oxidoreductase n=1 Tax=Pseudomonas agarici TaxID=46677 RepID=UPI0002F52F43|nr:SDR family NAD(P)-dependent oxidoreductase [Pseudomonas agarici]NWC10423.1 SDR family NAD(P)-dependent oxidoreductase [Pseudomonas agarici]SEK23727.1 Short-chain dehydrogenase [Pseudomonas agarici]
MSDFPHPFAARCTAQDSPTHVECGPQPPARRIWLAGASAGIGAAMTEVLLKSGVQLAVSARDAQALKALDERYPGQVFVVPGDLTDSQQVREIGECIKQVWGSLDTVIINAGTCEYVEAQAFDASVVEQVVRTNLLASSYCIEIALPLLRGGIKPHLVRIASAVTFLPLPCAEAQGASKAGMRHLFESLRIDPACQGIDVTLVGPGFVDTPLTRKNDFPMPLNWPADQAASYICEKLPKHPPEISLPALSMAGLWPPPLLSKRRQPAIDRRMVRNSGKDKDLS